MRITGNDFKEDRSYTEEERQRAISALSDACLRLEIISLLVEIKKDSAGLRNLFWTQEEIRDREEAENFFAVRMQSMVYYTLKNLKAYEHSGWRELIDERDDKNGEIDRA